MKIDSHLIEALNLLEEKDMKYSEIWDCIIAARDDLKKLLYCKKLCKYVNCEGNEEWCMDK